MPRKHKSSGPAAPAPLAGPQRLNKLLAAAGLGSRREVEQYIIDGRVEVDGQAVTDLATKVDPESATLTFDGSAIKIFRPVYFALNKPVGVLSTNRDPSGRMRAIDLVNVKERIFSAGRLDRSSEGLMLLTNDGELAQRLSHPRYGIQKLYLATVQGEVTQADLEKLIRGVRLAEGYAKVDAVKLRKQRSGAADLEIALSEGKNREIRRILARLGHKVVALKRLAIGPLRLGQLPTGGWRPLTKHEVQALYTAALTGRRKKRSSAKPLRGKPRPGSDDPALAPTMSAGQFDRYSDDDYEENFGPSLDEMDDDELGGDDELILNDESIRGSVIPYDDDVEDDVPDDGSFDDMLNNSDEDDDGEFGDEEDEAPVHDRPPRSRVPSGSTRSPNDLRNRNRKQGSGGGRDRGDRPDYKGSKGVKGSRPASGAPRGPKKASRPYSGTRSGSAAPRSSSGLGSRSSSGRSSGGYSRTSGEGHGPSRASAPGSSSGGPRSGGPRTGGPRTGAGRSGPSGGSRPSSSGPGRSGPGRSGPSRGASGGPGRSGPSSGGPRSGGPRSGPGRGGSGPGRSGPGRSGPGRSGPGRSGPGKGRGGGKR